MMKLLLILSVALNLIPAPVEYSPERSHTRFRKEIAKLEPWQQQEAYRITITKRRVKMEALTPEGEFRAQKTLEQLRAMGELPQGTIFDYPRKGEEGIRAEIERRQGKNI